MADTYFDRRAARELMDALVPGGFANSLVEFGRCGQYCLDLQLRHNAKSNSSWATLYVGTTKVLDLVCVSSGRMRLSAHETYANAKFGFDASWAKLVTPEVLAAKWPAVDSYLERSIEGVRKGYSKEGRVQASLSLYPALDMVVIDRETVIGYTNTAARKKILSHHLDPLMDGVASLGKEAWWRPKAPGNECDGLAIRADGKVLAIEVKPAGVSGVLWAPLQAIHYAGLLQHWADETPAASEILLGMYQQRAELGLLRQPFRAPAPAEPVRIQPVVAIGGDLSAVWNQRLATVAERLSGVGYDVEYRRVNLIGRMDPLEF